MTSLPGKGVKVLEMSQQAIGTNHHCHLYHLSAQIRIGHSPTEHQLLAYRVSSKVDCCELVTIELTSDQRMTDSNLGRGMQAQDEGKNLGENIVVDK